MSYAYFPYEARIRNLTYKVKAKVNVIIEKWERAGKRAIKEVEGERIKRTIDLCEIPAMIRSKYCHLSGQSNKTLLKNKECLFDSGGYFIINGSEKVIVAQERQATNIVLVFKNKIGKYSWKSEIRSQNE